MGSERPSIWIPLQVTESRLFYNSTTLVPQFPGLLPYRRTVFLEWYFQQTADLRMLIRRGMRINSIVNVFARHFVIGTKKPVPIRKNIAIIGIRTGST